MKIMINSIIIRPATGGVLMAIASIVPAYSQASQHDISDIDGSATIRLHAVGAQIYECKKTDHGNSEWAFREPVATLMADGKSIGVHSAGPNWRMNDGSSIKGAVLRQAAGTAPLDIPWLELKTTEQLGEGMLSNVTGIRRVDTKGGKLSGLCSAEGSFASVPYEAVYVFIKP